jgi:hypothetical protein
VYKFHTTIHALPADLALGTSENLAGAAYSTLAVSPEMLGATTFSCSFEQAMALLGRLERMYCEPDGSFVWVSSQQAPLWQVDGNLYDRAERLLFVDVKGSCPPEEFDRLLSCFGWPEKPVMFQLVREAVSLDEQEFRRWASRSQPPGPTGRSLTAG